MSHPNGLEMLDLEIKHQVDPDRQELEVFAILRSTGEEIGRLWARPVDDVQIFLKMIKVDEAYRRCRAGSALIQRLRELGAEAGFKTVYGDLLQRERDSLALFYRNNGFALTELPDGRLCAEIACKD